MNANRAIIVQDCTNNSGIFSTQHRGINGVAYANPFSRLSTGVSFSYQLGTVVGAVPMALQYHRCETSTTKKPQPRILSGYLAQAGAKYLR